MSAIAATLILPRRFGPGFLDLFDFVYKVVRRLEDLFSLRLTRHNVRFASVQQVQIRHRIVVVRSQLDRAVHAINTFLNRCSILLLIRWSQLWRKRVRGVELRDFIIKPLTQLSVGIKCHRPINDANPVVGFGILRTKLNMLLMVGLRFLKKIRAKGLTSHLKQQRAYAVERRKIIRIRAQYAFEFLDRLKAQLHVLVTGMTRNILRCVGGRKIQARFEESRIERLGSYEKLLSFFC